MPDCYIVLLIAIQKSKGSCFYFITLFDSYYCLPASKSFKSNLDSVPVLMYVKEDFTHGEKLRRYAGGKLALEKTGAQDILGLTTIQLIQGKSRFYPSHPQLQQECKNGSNPVYIKVREPISPNFYFFLIHILEIKNRHRIENMKFGNKIIFLTKYVRSSLFYRQTHKRGSVLLLYLFSSCINN